MCNKLCTQIKTLTIFTPTYNRAYILPKLYESLTKQSSKDFCWIIVDDGSTDNTKKMIQQWILENKVEILYQKQENRGKSMAHNKGVALTRTELFTCVDSDDYLVETAVEEIIKCWNSIRSKTDVTGILCFRKHSDGTSITTLGDSTVVTATLSLAYQKFKLCGDTMLIFKTNIIRKYKFPYFYDEKFVPESYLYDLIDREGKLFLLRKALYCGEYLPDGYTSGMSQLIKNNPRGYMAYIKQRLEFDNTLKQKLFDMIRYNAICIVSDEQQCIRNSIYPLLALLMLPFGYLLYLKKYKNIV